MIDTARDGAVPASVMCTEGCHPGLGSALFGQGLCVISFDVIVCVVPPPRVPLLH